MSRMWGTETSIDGQDHETNMMVTCHCTFRGSPLPNFPRPVKWSFLLKADFFSPLCSLFPSYFFLLIFSLCILFFDHPFFSLMLLSFPISISSFHFLHSQFTSFSHFTVLTCPISCCLSTFFLISLPWHISCAHNTYGTWRIWDQMTWVQHKSSCSIKLNTKAGSQLLLIMSIFNMKDC